MLKEIKIKKLEQLLKGKGWEEVTSTVKNARKTALMEMLASPRGSDLLYNHDDILKERIKIMNWFLGLPEKLLHRASEEKDDSTSKEGDKEEDLGDDLSIGDADDL